ncbi:unnamed protein product [Didymodactylos carnosus]|uniref:RUN and TBC1 domain-containing protein 3 n=1 Tax=Didymodactylos carnosus TaxID=1234261 RepID=A0A814INQ6_9BILA|nr:unnamed protein product [Didymodactylos carnosus]CAF1028494.1 unnamed protein product [Didymodactylos carnosus]CAF3645761.1 unnamed protein product [Didymodactylos carnosus]CAF3799537.1 unnamed protein product [Didymodactylos carnosus]
MALFSSHDEVNCEIDSYYSHSAVGLQNVTNGSKTNNDDDNTHVTPSANIAFSALVPSLVPQHLLRKTPLEDETVEYDEFGFRIESYDEESGDEEHQQERREYIPYIENEQQKLKWLSFLDSTYHLDVVNGITEQQLLQIEPKQIKQDDKFLKLLSESPMGIPHSQRPLLWMCLSGCLKKKHSTKLSYSDILKHCNNDQQLYSKQIEKDLLRTLPTNVCFMKMNSSGISRLRRILRAIAWLFPDIGYCQGTGVICGTLLLFYEEEDTFWMMCTLVEDLLPGQYYSVSLFGVQVDIRVFRYLIQIYLPQINELFLKHDIDLTLICFQWFLTLYSNVFHIRLTLRIWDYFFLNGSIVLFQIGLTLLKQHEPILLKLDNSAQIFNFLCELPSLFEFDQRTFIQTSHGLTQQQIDTYRKKLMAELMSAEGFTINPNAQVTNLPKDILQRRHGLRGLYRRQLHVKLSFRRFTTSQTHSIQSLAERNIQQTEMLVNLRDSILKIAKHFKDNDNTNSSTFDLNVDYSIESHVKDHEHYANISLQKCKRAKALLDFECQDSNELGFKKNDIIKILSMNDEHCWIGELNGKQGWFPGKFVQLVDERSKSYSLAGDDSVDETISDLVRGKLATNIKQLFEHGLRKSSAVLGGICHPWLFIEEAALYTINKDFDSVYARLILCKTYRLDEDGRILTPEELLCRSIRSINYTHNLAHAQMDVKFRSFICLGLNEQVLHLWLETLCSCTQIINKWYLPYSFLRSPCWVQIKCDLRVLQQFSFTLQQDYELPMGYKQLDVCSSVTDMLIKHHLFSWDL